MRAVREPPGREDDLVALVLRLDRLVVETPVGVESREENESDASASPSSNAPSSGPSAWRSGAEARAANATPPATRTSTPRTTRRGVRGDEHVHRPSARSRAAVVALESLVLRAQRADRACSRAELGCVGIGQRVGKPCELAPVDGIDRAAAVAVRVLQSEVRLREQPDRASRCTTLIRTRLLERRGPARQLQLLAGIHQRTSVARNRSVRGLFRRSRFRARTRRRRLRRARRT